MTLFKILESKDFMAKLLLKDTFDSFLLESASLHTSNSFLIDGHVDKAFYTTEELEEGVAPYDFSPWKDLQPVCFELIKGKKTPLSFKFVLHLMPEHVEQTLKKADSSLSSSDIKALVLNIKYDGNNITIVTATSFHTFIMDKSLDTLWDATIRHFLSHHNITFEEDL